MASQDHKGIDDITKFKRFINFGSEDGVYFPGERSFGKENAQLILRLVGSGKGEEIVSLIQEVCETTRQVRPLASIFSLAACARSSDLKTKHAAYKAVPAVCKTSTELFAFVGFAQILCSDNSLGEENKRPRPTGWGRAQRSAIGQWYTSKDPKQLAEDVTRIKQRGGWSHVDLLRLTHTKAVKDGSAVVLKYIIKGLQEVKKLYNQDDAADDVKKVMSYLEAVDTVKHSTDEHQVARLVEQHHLQREHLPTNVTKSKEVWMALLTTMPYATVLSTLGKMAALGLLMPDSDATKRVVERLKDEAELKDSKLHPFSVLVSWKVYEQGRGERGKLRWLPNPSIQEALNSAFYKSFQNVQPTKQKFVLGISITGSLALQGLNGTPAVSAAVAAATMALVTARTESHYDLVVFSSELRPVSLNKDMELVDICRALATESTKIPLGVGNMCLPITWATDQKKQVDVFVIYTDARSSSSLMTPLEALAQYRQQVNPRAKLVFCGMAPSTMLLGAAAVNGVLNVVNFDPSAPHAITNFIGCDV